MLATDCCLLITICFFFCLLFFFGNFGMDVEDLFAFVLAANQANIVLALRTAAIFAQSQSGGHQRVVTPCIASLAPRMSHSNYHASNIAYLYKKSNPADHIILVAGLS
jgi:hypothetical protein